jgi:hypothetical protein
VWRKAYSSCAQVCARRVANFHQSFVLFLQNIDTEELVIASEIMSRTPSFTNIVLRSDQSGLLPIEKVHKHERKNCKYVWSAYLETKYTDKSRNLYCHRIPFPNLNSEQFYMSLVAKTPGMSITKRGFQL